MQSNSSPAESPPKAVNLWLAQHSWIRAERSTLWHLTGAPMSQEPVATFCGRRIAEDRRSVKEPTRGSKCANCLIQRRRVTRGCKGVA